MKRKIILAVFVFCVLGATRLTAEPGVVVFHPNSEGFITTWLLRGSFPLKSLEDRTVDFLASQGGEAKIYTFKSIGTIVTDSLQKSNNRVWQLFVSPTYRIDFKPIFDPSNHVAAYAAAWLKSPKKRRAVLKVGSDDGVRVWLNGRLIHDNPAQRGMKRDDDIVPVTLQKGENFLLVKVDQGGGDWRFCLRFTDVKNHPLTDLAVLIPGKLPLKRILALDAQSIRVNTVLKPKGNQRVWQITLHTDAEMPLGPAEIPVKVILETEQGEPLATLFDVRLSMRKKATLRKEYVPQQLLRGKVASLKNNMAFVRLNVYSPKGNLLRSDSRPVFFY